MEAWQKQLRCFILLKWIKERLFSKKGLNFGEDMAAAYLIQHGHRVLEKNWRQKCGEIDIISVDKDMLVFTEVKQRKSDSYGRPAEFVTKDKQRKLRNTANIYIMKKHYKGNARFDVVEVLGEEKPEINHIKNAF